MNTHHWPHAPPHYLSEKGVYFVTGATYKKELIFCSDHKLEFVQNQLFLLAEKYAWALKAWAIFPNHYHFVARSPEDAQSLKKFISHFHTSTAIWHSRLHATPGKKIWYQYWDTLLTSHGSYLARLNYTMLNPVKHKIVLNAQDYPYCSAKWFEAKASRAFHSVVASIPIDSVNIYDEF